MCMNNIYKDVQYRDVFKRMLKAQNDADNKAQGLLEMKS